MDISGMNKAQALMHVGSIQVDKLAPRKAVAVRLVDRLVTDPHSYAEAAPRGERDVALQF